MSTVKAQFVLGYNERVVTGLLEKGINTMKNKYTVCRITAVLIAATLLMPLASCSIFARRGVIEAADKLGNAIVSGSAEDILSLSSKKHKQLSEDLNIILSGGGYSEEENKYADAVRATMEYSVDESSVKVDGDDATCDIIISLADYVKLTDGDYDTIEDLVSAVSSGDKDTITFTAEFAKKDDEWKVSNLNSDEFLKIFEYRNAEFTIGRASLIKTAEELAGYIESGSSSDFFSIDDGLTDEDTLMFLLAEGMTGDEVDFANSVRTTISATADSDSAEITGLYGTCDIVIEMADYDSLSENSYDSLGELLAAVATSEKMQYVFTAEFTRTGDTWHITNLNSSEFEDIFKYRYLVLSISDYSGSYAALVDVTNEFNAKIEETAGSGCANGFTGSIVAQVDLELNKDGTYSFGIDRDTFAAVLYDYADTNIDKLVTNMLGVSSTDQIELLVVIAGYKNYADMRSQLLDQVTDMLDGFSTSGLDRSGTYTISNGKITFCGSDDNSTTDDITGTIDSYGNITVTAPITDPDAVMLFGSDEITLTFAPND